MSYIIGKGRYTRETYPEAFGGPSQRGIVQMGWDETVKSHSILPVTGLFQKVLTRDDGATPLPLQVQLPKVTPGNILRIGLTGNVCNGSAGPLAFTTVLVVSFNGNTNFAPATGFFNVDDSFFSQIAPASQEAVLGGTKLVVIPAGATTATVQVTYDDGNTGSFLTFGIDSGGIEPGLNLEAWEISRNVFAQIGPTTLLAI